MQRGVCLLFLILSMPLMAVQLHYPVGTPVPQRLSILLSVRQEGPQMPIDLRAEQTLDFLLEVEEELPEGEGKEVSVRFQRLQVDVESAGETVHYDSKLPENNPALAEFASIVDKPIRLQVDSQGKLVERGRLQMLYNRLPLLEQLLPKTFFQQLFQQIFALGREEIVQKETYRREAFDGVSSLPHDYRVTDVGNGMVRAAFRGETRDNETTLTEVRPELQVVLSGRTVGEVVWNAHNSLQVELQSSALYQGKVKVGGVEYPVSVTADYRLQTLTLE